MTLTDGRACGENDWKDLEGNEYIYNVSFLGGGGGGGGTQGKFGSLQTLTLFKTKIVHIATLPWFISASNCRMK